MGINRQKADDVSQRKLRQLGRGITNRADGWEMDREKIERLAKALAEDEDADIIIYNGVLEWPNDHKFRSDVRSAERRKNVFLILTTPGGDAHAAYRMARCLQRHYQRFTVVIPGFCKSAGTLFAIGAHEIRIGDRGELGPLDVQMPKQDELWEMSSGLTVMEAIDGLRAHAFVAFEEYMQDIKRKSRNQITFKTAAEISAQLACGLFKPMFEKIDPMHVGDANRSMTIARDYGGRLDRHSDNLISAKTLDKLVAGYSSHGFVIDQDEVADFFKNVKHIEGKLLELCEELGDGACIPTNSSDSTFFFFLNHVDATDEKDQPEDTTHGDGEPRSNGSAPPEGAAAEGTDGDQEQGDPLATLRARALAQDGRRRRRS